ncbi:monocarboxylate transporter 13 [Aplysia californica]|uniref:Monocarboxylate transporter 13 n=1 Tax=Aplysia californica TaxID=6500 RepID=A0ABM1A204_APLCA|nr:monocarboxylate transporter 13 [Aplysia californica]
MTERAQSSGQRDSLMGNQDADLSSDHHLLTKQEENSLEITREISEKEKNDKDGDDDDDDDGVPTDSGWSWVITFSTFTGFVLLAGYDFTMYFLFPDLVVRFDSRVSVMTSMFSIQSICMSVASVFAANVLMPRYSVRVITVGAGLTSALTTLLMSQAPNMGTFLALTALKGLCHGVLGVCPVTLLGFYFKRRRSLAQALANVGLCVGSMAFPSVVQALRSQYGVQGSLMILSSLELHYVAVYLLLRPVESYR